MQIAKLPALNQGTFGPLVRALAEALIHLRAGTGEVIRFELLTSSQGDNPYCQMYVNDHLEVLVEISGGQIFLQGFTKWDESQLRLLGFLPPVTGNPNFWKVFRENESPMVQAKAIVEIFRIMFGFNDMTPFTLGESEYVESLVTRFQIPKFDGEYQLLRLQPEESGGLRQ